MFCMSCMGSIVQKTWFCMNRYACSVLSETVPGKCELGMVFVGCVCSGVGAALPFFSAACVFLPCAVLQRVQYKRCLCAMAWSAVCVQ